MQFPRSACRALGDRAVADRFVSTWLAHECCAGAALLCCAVLVCYGVLWCAGVVWCAVLVSAGASAVRWC
jgi:hypothetical protein